MNFWKSYKVEIIRGIELVYKWKKKISVEDFIKILVFGRGEYLVHQ